LEVILKSTGLESLAVGTVMTSGRDGLPVGSRTAKLRRSASYWIIESSYEEGGREEFVKLSYYMSG